LTDVVKVVLPSPPPVIQVSVDPPEVVKVVSPSAPQVVQAVAPGPAGPPGKDGTINGEELPDLVVLFNNGLI